MEVEGVDWMNTTDSEDSIKLIMTESSPSNPENELEAQVNKNDDMDIEAVKEEEGSEKELKIQELVTKIDNLTKKTNSDDAKICYKCNKDCGDMKKGLICDKCDRSIHLKCLEDKSSRFQSKTKWICVECSSYTNEVGRVLTRRPVAENVYEYLVKFKEKSYRDVAWVSQSWLESISIVRVRWADKKFAEKTPSPEEAVPAKWLLVDKVLSVEWKRKGHQPRFTGTRSSRILDSDDEGYSDSVEKELEMSSRLLIKWQGLDYDESTWEKPFKSNDPSFSSLKKAFINYKRGVEVALFQEAEKFTAHEFRKIKEQPTYIQGGTLLDYQLDGVK